VSNFGTYDQHGSIIRASDGAVIPAVLSNMDYRDAMAAVAAGATIAPYVAPVIDQSAADLATLNAVLAEPGSVVRALGLVMFAEINKLRVAGGAAAYTMPQFVAALKAQMR
jgi:hypothetical protein